MYARSILMDQLFKLKQTSARIILFLRHKQYYFDSFKSPLQKVELRYSRIPTSIEYRSNVVFIMDGHREIATNRKIQLTEVSKIVLPVKTLFSANASHRTNFGIINSRRYEQ